MDPMSKDAAYRAETLHYLRKDTGLAASRLPASVKPIWEDVMLSIEYGQPLRDMWAVIENMLIFNIAINMALPGYPRYLLEGDIKTLHRRLAQYA